jgi:hypothetical protein
MIRFLMHRIVLRIPCIALGSFLHGPPHVRAHRACSKPLLASEILGLYLVSAQGERTAFCDIHSWGAALDTVPWHNVVYTGPA